MSPERTSWHLANWARWMHRDTVVVGYPRRSAVIMGSMHTDFDAMAAAIDEYCAEHVDALIADLSPIQRAAVEHSWLGTQWRYPWLDTDTICAQAIIVLGQGLDVRGII